MNFNKAFLRPTFIALVIFSLPHSLRGQITLTQYDFGSIGDSVGIFSDTTYFGPVSAGQPGAAQVWTFSFPGMVQLDSIQFVAPALTPNGVSFPGSNIAIKEDLSYSYFNKSANSILLNGFNIDLDTFFSGASIKISPALTYLNFPASFGDHWSSTGTGSVFFPLQDTVDIGTGPVYVDSVRVDFTVSQKDTINGYGLLNLDTSSTQVLRLESWQNISLNIWAKIEFPVIGFIWFPVPIPIFPDFTLRSVSYFGKNADYPLLGFELDSAGDILSNFFQFNPPQILSLKDQMGNAEQYLAFPNPVENRVYFKPNLEDIEIISIMDLKGKQVQFSGPYDLDQGLDVSFLSSGVYFLELLSSNGTHTLIRITKN